MLKEVKEYSERKIPVVDLDGFIAALDEVVGLEALNPESTYSSDQKDQISKLLGLLPPFSEEALIFEECPDRGKRFHTKFEEVATWFKTFTPDFSMLGEELAESVSGCSPTLEDSLHKLSEAFPPSVFSLPSKFDEIFFLQCALACSVELSLH